MNGNEPKNFIEINGNKYDADTGRLLEAAVEKSFVKPVSARSVDGFVKVKVSQPAEATVPSKAAREHAKPSNHVDRKPQKSATLMRPAVKKPDHKVDNHDKKVVAPKVTPGVPHSRIKRAEQTKLSDKITRFKPNQISSTIEKRVAPLKVVKMHQAHPQAKSKEDFVTHFEKAIEDATSHLEEFVGPKNKKKRNKLAIVTISLAVLLAGGVVLYQAVPATKVRVAGTKAGFSASLPSYSPAGFGLDGSVKATSGEVSLSYKSRTDDKNYNIKQTPSDWNSDSLVNNFLLPANKEFQTFDSNGTTIYVYDGSNATWVSGGIWYVLEGNANLTSDQLLRIASGL